MQNTTFPITYTANKTAGSYATTRTAHTITTTHGRDAIIITETPDDKGPSVTNSAEEIRHTLTRLRYLTPEANNILLLERYVDADGNTSSLSLVTHTENGPTWTELPTTSYNAIDSHLARITSAVYGSD